MVTRRVAVVLEGTSTSLVRAFEQASAAADRAGDRISRVGSHVEKNADAYQRAGTMIAGFGAATLAAQGASAAAAISWQSDFAGVRKTVDDTAEGYAELSGELRGMATELPASHSAIAGVAEAAGQLGISRENITAFTKTMVDLGETTNLSADEAATSLARFSNIMGTSQDEVSNLGSAIVDLGNNYATTEREIVEMGLRLAGAGRQARLSEGDVLGLATALSSVGIEAEAGGTAFSRVLIEMGTSVDQQNEKLRTFAEVSGMSAEQFSTAWRDDAGSAIAAFVAGLGEMESSGQSIQPVLDDLGMTDIRVGDALRRASSAADIFTEAMETGNVAYSENTALTKEAEQRYGTVASQLSVLKNNLVDAGISMGEVFLPAISALAEHGATALQWISGLPEPLRQIAGWGGAAGGGAALLAGGLMIAAPQAHATYKALQALNVVGPKTTGVLRNVAGFLTGPWGLAIGGAVVAMGLFMEAKRRKREAIEEVIATLDEETGELTENTREWAVNRAEQEGALEWADQLGLRKGVVADAIMGDVEAYRELTGAVDDALAAQQANTDAWGVAEAQYGRNADAARKLADFVNYSTDAVEEGTDAHARQREEMDAGIRATEVWGDRLTALAQAEQAQAAAQDGATEATRRWVSAMDQAKAAGDEAAEAYNDFITQTAGYSQAFIDSSGALDVANQAAQTWAEGQAEAAGKGTDAWDQYVDDFTGTVDEWLAELERQQEAQVNWESNMLLLAANASEGVVRAFEELGPQGAPLLAEFIDGGMAELDRAEALFGEKGSAHTYAYAEGMANSGVWAALGARWGQETLAQVQDEFLAGGITLEEIVAQYGLEASVGVSGDLSQLGNDLGTAVGMIDEAEGTVDIHGDRVSADATLGELIGDVDEADGTVDILGNRIPADITLGTLLGIINDSDGTVTIDGNDYPADQVREALLQKIRDSRADVTIGANTYSATSALDTWIRNHNGRQITVYQMLRRGYDAPVATGGSVDAHAAAAIGRTHLYTGGPVRGPGSGTSDEVPAGHPSGVRFWLSNGEHVWTDAEVRALGGHEEVYRLRKAALAGAVRFDIGGAVDHDRHVRASYAPPIMRPAPASAPSAGPLTAVLAAEDRALLTAVATRPVQLEADGKVMARVVASGTDELGGRLNTGRRRP